MKLDGGENAVINIFSDTMPRILTTFVSEDIIYGPIGEMSALV